MGSAVISTITHTFGHRNTTGIICVTKCNATKNSIESYLSLLKNKSQYRQHQLDYYIFIMSLDYITSFHKLTIHTVCSEII